MTGDFTLYEAMLWEPEQRYFLLDHHMQRLRRSAAYFDFSVDVEELRAGLLQFASRLDRPRKIRAMVSSNGAVAIEDEDVKPSTPIGLALADSPVHATDVFLRHKTSRREVYDRALAAHPEAKDILLWNRERELTETCHGNIVLAIGGKRLTPRESAGLLPGTFRAHLLEQGAIEEARLTLDDLDAAERLFMINSVRKWCEARLLSRQGHGLSSCSLNPAPSAGCK